MAKKRAYIRSTNLARSTYEWETCDEVYDILRVLGVRLQTAAPLAHRAAVWVTISGKQRSQWTGDETVTCT